MGLLALILGCSCAEDRDPDVVFVLVDTLRADALSFAGAPLPTSPHLDALVESEAAWYTRAYSASSWTLASTATLITGQRPFSHGVVRAADNDRCYGRLQEHLPTLGSVWRTRGYRTGAWINNGFLAPEFGFARSFDVYDYEGAELLGHRTAAQTVDAALEWLDAGEGPAFMMVHLMEPHVDYDPGPPFAGTFTSTMPASISIPLGSALHGGWMARVIPPPDDDDRAFVRAAYQEEVLAVDQAVHTLIEGLKSRDRWDDAFFVLTSDHGEEFWEHGGFEHGHTMRSEVTRVPLIVKAPTLEPGKRDQLVDAVSVSRALAAGHPGPLVTGDAFALSEDILYGPQMASIVTPTHRLEVALQTNEVTLWELDPSGWEPERWMQDSPEVRQVAGELRDQLRSTRGGLAAAQPVNPTGIDREVFQMLRELGYIDGGAVANPCE
ncbi:MAG TPA: sulfatase [Myxococcota bacterium]|nr:sulfatase [Myxococcota bacterium]